MDREVEAEINSMVSNLKNRYDRVFTNLDSPERELLMQLIRAVELLSHHVKQLYDKDPRPI